jgi:hypothetical protein
VGHRSRARVPICISSSLSLSIYISLSHPFIPLFFFSSLSLSLFTLEQDRRACCGARSRASAAFLARTTRSAVAAACTVGKLARRLIYLAREQAHSVGTFASKAREAAPRHASLSLSLSTSPSPSPSPSPLSLSLSLSLPPPRSLSLSLSLSLSYRRSLYSSERHAQVHKLTASSGSTETARGGDGQGACARTRVRATEAVLWAHFCSQAWRVRTEACGHFQALQCWHALIMAANISAADCEGAQELTYTERRRAARRHHLSSLELRPDTLRSQTFRGAS